MSDTKQDDQTLATEPKPAEGQADSDDPGDPPGSDVQAEARPKKKKKAKPESEKAQSSEELAQRPLNAEGRERPLFLTEFPEDPELSRLVSAFEAGNYGLVRSDAERLAEQTQDPRVRDAALELRRRIDPDPLIKYLLGLAFALLLFLVFYTYHSH